MQGVSNLLSSSVHMRQLMHAAIHSKIIPFSKSCIVQASGLLPSKVSFVYHLHVQTVLPM